MRKLHLYLSALILLFPFSGCNDNFHSSIPDVPFTIRCDMRQAAYSSLYTPGQFVIVDKNNHGYKMGYAGLIIGQSTFTGMNNEPVYYALDRACPVEADPNVAVNLQKGIGKAVCPRCGTEYDLNSGGVPNGKGTEFLKRYSITRQGDILTIVSR